MKFKRRSIVVEHNATGHRPFGRIQSFTSTTATVVFCTRECQELPLNALELVTSYSGFYDHRKRFHRMPSMRKLKQMCSRYDKSIWKKRRPAKDPS